MLAAERARRLGYSVAGILGYILSPASWWNDAVVNIPVSLAIAGVLHRLTGLPMDALFAAAYWATNIAGIILMAVGAEGASRGSASRRSVLLGVAAGTLYTAVVVWLLRLAGAAP